MAGYARRGRRDARRGGSFDYCVTVPAIDAKALHMQEVIEWHRLRYRRKLTRCVRRPHPRHESEWDAASDAGCRDERGACGDVRPALEERSHVWASSSFDRDGEIGLFPSACLAPVKGEFHPRARTDVPRRKIDVPDPER